METAIEILNRILPDGIAQYGAQIDRKILQAMEEYAKQFQQSGGKEGEVAAGKLPSIEEIENELMSLTPQSKGFYYEQRLFGAKWLLNKINSNHTIK